MACGDNFRDGAAETDQGQGEAMDYMVSKGVQLRRFPPQVMQALEEKWLDVVAEEGAKNPNFRKAWGKLRCLQVRQRHLGRRHQEAIGGSDLTVSEFLKLDANDAKFEELSFCRRRR